LQAEVVRLSERETSMQGENQHLQEKIIHLEKVSHTPDVILFFDGAVAYW